MTDRRPVTKTLVELLATTGLPIGDHKAPVEVALKPWATVYSIAGGGLLDDNLAAVDDGIDLIYQVTSAGRRRDQAEWMSDLARRTIVGRGLTGLFVVPWPEVTGFVVADRQLWGGLGGVTPSGDPPQEVWSVAERFLIRLTRQ